MIKIRFLGTCSGTEPMPNMHHCSIVFEINGLYYWFDAGENCSHAAYTSDILISKVRAIFISHMHVDHIGGLANLLFTIDKVVIKHKIPHVNNNSYDIFVPDLKKLESVKDVAEIKNIPADDTKHVKIIEHIVHDGVIYEDKNIKVSALHNTHLKEDGTNGWHSYSYLIESEGKRIVFSGDVGKPEDLDEIVKDNCDLLIMETGHHAVKDVCEYSISKNVKKLLFNHHGREILRDRKAACELIHSYDINAEICYDNKIEII